MVPTEKQFAHPRSVRFTSPTTVVVSCHVLDRSVSACTFATTRLMLFFDGRKPIAALPVFAEYIRPNVYPKKSNSPSGTLQMRVFSSFTVSFSLPMISRSRCKASSALPLRHKITSRLPSSIVGFFHGAVQPHLDQMQHAPIDDPARHRLQKLGMGNAPEVVREVGVHHFPMATEQQLFHLDHRLLGVSPRSVGV